MKWYWVRIAFGAIAVFAVGYAGVSAFRGARSGVEHVVRSSADVSLPLPFLPFVFEGNEVGKLRRLVLHRSDPKHLSGIDLSIRVADPAAIARLGASCHLTVDNPRHIDNHTTFQCVPFDSAMERFGEVTVFAKDAEGDWGEALMLPLVLPRSVVANLEGEEVAESVVGAEADEIQKLADSIRAVSLRIPGASDAQRAELSEELRRLRIELRDIELAVAEVAKARAAVRITAPGVRLEVTPEVPKPPAKP